MYITFNTINIKQRQKALVTWNSSSNGKKHWPLWYGIHNSWKSVVWNLYRLKTENPRTPIMGINTGKEKDIQGPLMWDSYGKLWYGIYIGKVIWYLIIWQRLKILTCMRACTMIWPIHKLWKISCMGFIRANDQKYWHP